LPVCSSAITDRVPGSAATSTSSPNRPIAANCDSPIAVSTRAIVSESWIAANSLRVPPQFGQTNTSIANTRCNNSAQRSAITRD
jgi:hypothetical protein